MRRRHRAAILLRVNTHGDLGHPRNGTNKSVGFRADGGASPLCGSYQRLLDCIEGTLGVVAGAGG